MFLFTNLLYLTQVLLHYTEEIVCEAEILIVFTENTEISSNNDNAAIFII